ncbi:MAG: hypothetical protein WCQ06_00010 [Actinomycetes bacterium]|jgi:hypothetical protein
MDIVEIKERIARVQELPLDDHVAEFDLIHGALEGALSTVEGI